MSDALQNRSRVTAAAGAAAGATSSTTTASFRSYPFPTAVQNRYCEYLMDVRRYRAHRNRIADIGERGRDVVQPVALCDATMQQKHSELRKSVQEPSSDNGNEMLGDLMDEISDLFGADELSDHDRIRQSPAKPSRMNPRQREIARDIALQNEAIYRRLIVQRSSYGRNTSDPCWKLHEERMSRISKFQHPWRSSMPPDTRSKLPQSLPPIVGEPSKRPPTMIAANLVQRQEQSKKAVSFQKMRKH